MKEIEMVLAGNAMSCINYGTLYRNYGTSLYRSYRSINRGCSYNGLATFTLYINAVDRCFALQVHSFKLSLVYVI